MSIRRSDRLVDMTRYILDHPRELVSLSYFAERYDSAKSSISEDLVILKRTFQDRGIGVLETVPGASGGTRFVPTISVAEATQFVDKLIEQVDDPTRVLPGGYVFLSDLLGQPLILKGIAKIISTEYLRKNVDAVMTAATKGVPLAEAVAEQLNVPFVIVRSGAGKVTEGPTVSINFLTGTGKNVEKMELSRRSLKTGSKVLIVDDFMKAGGTIQGMQDLVTEFDGTVVGTAVFAEGRSKVRLINDFTSLLHIDTNKDDQTVIDVSVGNYLEKIYPKRAAK